MDTKVLEIVAPEGYEIDSENSTLEKIIFKKKDDRPRTWEEFCKRGFTGKEGYVVPNGALQTNQATGAYRTTTDVGYVDSIEEAKAFVALMQLRRLRKAWVGDWEPNWKVNNSKYVILVIDGNIRVMCNVNISRCLSFPDREMAEEFMECFKDLLEQAKILL